ncbi:MAG: hypothetical protein ACOCZK_00330 [Planctomycetota bacterium]
MPPDLTPLLLSMAPAALFVVLRMLSKRDRSGLIGEPEGLRVYRGERSACERSR